ncbi:lipid A deacylase LpxR family protein [Oleidesulfovibrio sp.]|uniref:lipid A deacylase LpxR family protein n=1 Tax=Oleidesulfovibrio sp. TaxID=2909707 RepID=UPI003A84F8D9
MALCCFWGSAAPVFADSGKNVNVGESYVRTKAKSTRSVFFYFENDLFADTDQYYTNAVQMTVVSQDLPTLAADDMLPDQLDTFLNSLPLEAGKDSQYNVSLTLGQHIYTPSDTQTTELLENDRPYAGYLYGALGMHAKRDDRLDSLVVTLGVVGPAALGEYAQNTVHSVRDIPTAKGWENQLNNEPGLMVTYERAWRLNPDGSGRGWGWDVIPHAGITAGNVMTYANTGGEVRLGYNLPADFGTSLIRPGAAIGAPTADDDPRLQSGAESFGMYFFAGADLRAVAWNMFLDGNTMSTSHHVAKKSLVADFNGGVALMYGRYRISYTHVLRTREFYNQEKAQQFGSLTFAITF